MNRRFFAVLCFAALAAAAQDTKSLVDAAKNAKAKRKGSTTKVITNADVKKAKGTVVEKKPAPAKPAATAEKKPEPKPYVDQDDLYRQRIAADETLAAAQKKVNELERELRAVEESFYNEDDLDKRDNLIAKKFEETKTQLADARAALKAASDVRVKLQ
ncbi:MAG: hypothetical protein JOZ54_00970 [Acidobacteria bacterium]|nr:hypothetical protein [Acidobacteriota bacterium]